MKPKTLKEYAVRWTIEVDAFSPTDAAKKAHEVMLDPHSIALGFDVRESTQDVEPWKGDGWNYIELKPRKEN